MDSCLQLTVRRDLRSLCSISDFYVTYYVNTLPFFYLLPCNKRIYCKNKKKNDEKGSWRSAHSRYLCSPIPFLSCSLFAPLALGWMRDMPPCCACGGRKWELRRQLCRPFSLLSFSVASALSFALGSPFHVHFGLGLTWVGFWNTRRWLNDVLYLIWWYLCVNYMSFLPRGTRSGVPDQSYLLRQFSKLRGTPIKQRPCCFLWLNILLSVFIYFFHCLHFRVF